MARRHSAEESSGESTMGSLESGGLTTEERAALDATNEAKEESALKSAVVAAVEKVRSATSHLDDLMHRHDKGLPVTRQHLGDVKTHLDAAVTELADAASL